LISFVAAALGCLLGVSFMGSVHAQPADTSWSVSIDPSTGQASGVHWTVQLAAPYCGGYRLGDGVHIQPQAPLAFPDTVPSDGVVLAGQPAQAALDGGVLVVSPAPGLAQSMICMPGEQPLTVELVPSLGMANPDPGNYVVDVWLGSSGAAVQLPVTVDTQSE
jgi:hypothetical protein